MLVRLNRFLERIFSDWKAPSVGGFAGQKIGLRRSEKMATDSLFSITSCVVYRESAALPDEDAFINQLFDGVLHRGLAGGVLRTARQFGRTCGKTVAAGAHPEEFLDESGIPCYTKCEDRKWKRSKHDQDTFPLLRQHLPDVKNACKSSASCVLTSVLPMIYQYFWRAKLVVL